MIEDIKGQENMNFVYLLNLNLKIKVVQRFLWPGHIHFLNK